MAIPIEKIPTFNSRDSKKVTLNKAVVAFC